MQTKSSFLTTYSVTALFLSVALLFSTLPVMSQAQAQEKSQEYPSTQPDTSTEEVEKIAIVGTRTAPRSVGDSPVPVDIIDGDDFRKQGSTDMITLMQSAVPSFNVNEQPINDASTLVRPANLRGMASDHTLVLVNGKRRHRSAVITFLGSGLSDGAQGPDLATIPTIALQQIEVLRDGAAAQYGSDAIAGVINFQLKDASEGGLVELHYGKFYEGDGQALQLAGNIGLPLTDDGFVNLSLEYRQADATSRSVQSKGAAVLTAAGNTHIANPAQIWGMPEVKGDVKLFANAGLELSDGREAYLFGNYAKREIKGGFYYRNPQGRDGVYKGPAVNERATLLVADLDGAGQGISCPTVYLDDNILQNAVYQTIADNSTAVGKNCFAFNEILPGGFTPNFGGVITDASLVFGTKGEFADEVNYDVSVNLGQNEIAFNIQNTLNPSMGPVSPRAFKPGRYIQSEQTFDVDLSKAFELGLEEPLYLAGGVQYRHESYEGIAGDPKSYEVGPLATQGFGIGSNGFPGLSNTSQGVNSRSNIAVYLDAELIVSEGILLTSAVRYENFSDFGSTTKGKVSFKWDLNDVLALRGALSTGFKAPTIGQSHVRNVTTSFSEDRLVDTATLPPTDPVAILKGAKPLKPEESRNASIGVVAEFDNGLFITADYYQIKLNNRISTTSGIKLTQSDVQTLLDQGVQDASSFAKISFFTNDFDTTTEGLDLVANIDVPMLGGNTRLSLAYNWTSTTVGQLNAFHMVKDENGKPVKKYNVQPAKIRMLEDNLPANRYTLSAIHSNGNWNALTRFNYFSGTFDDHLDAGGAFPINMGAEYTLDLELGYRFSDAFTLTLGARNALNNYPDENLEHNWVVGAKYPLTSPIGINGGYYYLRGVYQF